MQALLPAAVRLRRFEAMALPVFWAVPFFVPFALS